jgi:hypothetical protein
MIQADFGNKTLEPLASFGSCTRLPQIFINDQDAGFRPSQRHGPLHQAVLQAGRLLMIEDLLHGRLPHIHDGEALKVPKGQLLTVPVPHITSRVQTHDCPPPLRVRR